MASLARKPAPDRHEDPPARRPGQGLRAGQVSVRRPARGDALRRDALQPARPRQGQVDRHLGRREDARRQGGRSRSPRRGRPSATTATTSPPWPPRPRSRPATPSAPSRSSTRSCPTSSPRPRRWPTGRPRSSRAATSARAGRQTKGKPEEAMAKADVDDRGDLLAAGDHPRLPRAARPDRQVGRRRQDDAWASTQAVRSSPASWPTRSASRRRTSRSSPRYMGGGFGSKFGADIWGRTAAELSKKAAAGRSRCSSTGSRSTWPAGNRPSASAKIKLGATKDGKLVAMIAETHGTGGSAAAARTSRCRMSTTSPTLVADPHRRLRQLRRRPGHAGPGPSPGLRPHGSGHGRPGRQARHRPARVPAQEPGRRTTSTRPIYEAEVKIGAELIGWQREAQAARPERQGADQARPGHGPAPVGRRRHPGQEGLLHDQPRRLGRAQDAPPRTSAPAPGPSWRSSPPRSSASSRPTSSRTSATRRFPPGQASGGSTTTPSMAPPCLDAVTKARDALFKKIAPALKAEPEDLSLKDGQLWSRASRSWRWKDACRKLGHDARSPRPASSSDGLSSVGRRRLPVRRGDASTSRPAWSRSRRSSPSRTRA